MSAGLHLWLTISQLYFMSVIIVNFFNKSFFDLYLEQHSTAIAVHQSKFSYFSSNLLRDK